MVQLRPMRRDDISWMAAMATDRSLVGEHNWPGENARSGSDVEQELLAELDATQPAETAGHGRLVVETVGDDPVPIGEVTWRTERWGPSERSRCPAFGIALLPEYRGRGLGTAAQRQLIDHLFASDPGLHRVQSDTAVDNPAEQRSLEKAGMVREGVVRHAEFRDGRFHDHVLYSILRAEWEA
jgi:aminoglycoside 6'-N-acetyltransferase